jgi:hypothetical protein
MWPVPHNTNLSNERPLFGRATYFSESTGLNHFQRRFVSRALVAHPHDAIPHEFTASLLSEATTLARRVLC